MLPITVIAIVTAIATIKEVESVKYRNDLKARKAERLAELARKAQEEKIEIGERQMLINIAISNFYKNI